MKDIQILPAVLQDIAEAAAWYDDDCYTGLGDRFIATFYNYFPIIRENGSIYRRAYLDLGGGRATVRHSISVVRG